MSYHEIRATVAALDPSMGLRDTIASAIRRTGLPVSPASGGKHRRTNIMIIDEMRAAVGLPELEPPMGLAVAAPPPAAPLASPSAPAPTPPLAPPAPPPAQPSDWYRSEAQEIAAAFPVRCDDLSPLAERLAAAAVDKAANASRLAAAIAAERPAPAAAVTISDTTSHLTLRSCLVGFPSWLTC